jgi:hypothetical protein
MLQGFSHVDKALFKNLKAERILEGAECSFVYASQINFN